MGRTRTASTSGAAPSIWAKLTSEDVTWTKAELHNVLLVVKFLSALAVGVGLGVVPITGAAGFAVYITCSFVVPFLVYHSWLRVDEEEFGGHMTIVMEDQNVALPVFLLAWILTYSTLHW